MRSGFDNTKTDAEFFPEERRKSNFLCNLGYGEASKLHPRISRQEYNPMLSVEQCSLPDNSRLSSYSKEGSYADGYTTGILGRVTLADFVTAFYTTVIFKIERTILH